MSLRTSVVGSKGIRSIAVPMLNINGTHDKELIDAQVEVVTAARVLLEKLRNARPHGRDFQTCDAGSYERASAEHDAREAAVTIVMEDAEALSYAIDSQVYALDRE